MRLGRAALGQRAERYVEGLYVADGFDCVARNWSCRGGELDLVMRRAELVVFVEVRSVSTRWLDSPIVTVNAAKQRRVALAADAFARKRLSGRENYRFDVVGVQHRSGEMRAHIVENAFVPPWSF